MSNRKTSETENMTRLLDANFNFNGEEKQNVDFSEIPYNEKEDKEEEDTPPECENDEIHQIVHHLVANNGKIDKICDAIENFEPSNREEIIIEVEQIAKKIENVELGTFVARAGGAVTGIAGAVVGIVGALLILGVEGIAATIVLPAVAVGVSCAAALASVGGYLTNDIYKSKQFKKMEKLIENEIADCEFFPANIHRLQRLLEENDRYVYTLWNELMASTSWTEGWKAWVERMLQKAASRINLTIIKMGNGGRVEDPLGNGGHVDDPLGNGGHVDDPLGNGGHVDDPLGNGGHVGDPLRNGGRVDDPLGNGGRVDDALGNGGRVDDPLGNGGRVDDPLGNGGRVDPPLGMAAALMTHWGMAAALTTHWGMAAPLTIHWGMAAALTTHGGMAVALTTHWGMAAALTTHWGMAAALTTHWGMVSIVFDMYTLSSEIHGLVKKRWKQTDT